MKLFFSAGEPSGDLHGANLIRQLRCRDPSVECTGFGGPRMAEVGCVLIEDLTQLAVMWFARVLARLHHFWHLVGQAERQFRHDPPDVVILIDYPGFNWWIAWRAKKHAIPVVYYGAPQLWAWAAWRIKKMHLYVDQVLCKLPFEEAWYRQRGCDAKYVGHPYFDQMHQQVIDEEFVNRFDEQAPLVTILPGSRTQEVEQNLHSFLKTAQLIVDAVPKCRFAIASFNQKHAVLAKNYCREFPFPVEIHIGRTPELIAASQCCLACSGSVSLELLFHTKPSVILYTISPLAFKVQDRFRKARYITLVNLLYSQSPFLDRAAVDEVARSETVPMPEYLTCEDRSSEMADHVTNWLLDPARKQNVIEQLSDLKASFAKPGASRVAAEHILAEFGKRGCRPIITHHTPIVPFRHKLPRAA